MRFALTATILSAFESFDENDSECVASGVVDGQRVDAEVPTQPERSTSMCSRSNKTVRHFVHHNYHDHCIGNNNDKILSVPRNKLEGPRGGVVIAFPVLLHRMLSCAKNEMFDHIVSWQPHGRCFRVHQPAQFVQEVMPRWFKQSKLTSFQRQLNLYGFSRLTTGLDSGGYYHEMFLRGHPDLCEHMVRTRIKGTGVKAAPSPSTEPNFCKMHPCICTADKRSNQTLGALPLTTCLTQQIIPRHLNPMSTIMLRSEEKAVEQQLISPSSPQSVVTQVDDSSVSDAFLRLASRCSTPSFLTLEDRLDEAFDEEHFGNNWLNSFDGDFFGW